MTHHCFGTTVGLVSQVAAVYVSRNGEIVPGCEFLSDAPFLNGIHSEDVVQAYGICIRTLHLPVISVIIIGVMRLSQNEIAVSEDRFRHHLFQAAAVFARTTYPSRYVYSRWSKFHTAVETAFTATVVM